MDSWLAIRERVRNAYAMRAILCCSALAAMIPMAGMSAGEPTQPAQTAQPAQPVKIDMEARKASVVNLEAQIAERETRLGELGQDIITLDARIEKRMDSVVKLLADRRDSNDSRTRVSKIKQDAIDGLQRAVNAYSQKRRELAERVKSGNQSAQADLGKFDQRIFKRVDQIVELSKSFPTHEDKSKYESSNSGSYWRGYYDDDTRISDDWKQNRRDSTQANKQRDEIAKAIRDSLGRLDQRRRSLKDILANRKPSASARSLYQQELGQIDAYTERLNAQLVEVTSETSAGGRKLGLDEAIDLGQLLDDARRDLREDISNLFKLYDQFDRARFQLNALKENLAARKAWLEKNAGGQ